METPIKMDDLGVPLFLETPIYSIAAHDTRPCSTHLEVRQLQLQSKETNYD